MTAGLEDGGREIQGAAQSEEAGYPVELVFPGIASKGFQAHPLDGVAQQLAGPKLRPSTYLRRPNKHRRWQPGLDAPYAGC